VGLVGGLVVVGYRWPGRDSVMAGSRAFGGRSPWWPAHADTVAAVAVE